MRDVLLSSYIAKKHKGEKFTDDELKVLKDGNLESMVSTFVPLKNERYNHQHQSVLKSMKY